MNETFLWSLAALALALVIAGGVRRNARKRHEQLQARGYELIFSLKAYSAWVDWQCDEPIMSRNTDELTSPKPLARAREIKQAAFPGLTQHMLRLLQAHSHLVEYLWQQNLLRLSLATGWRPAYQDPQYQQIRGAQEDLIQEMIGLVQEAIGDRAEEWRRTGSDFAFSGSTSLSTVPGAASGA
ncbi:MAG TPA: hypothetical protein VNN06_19255 [Ramlibacter sp.]|nr:hypothetical protein [Ramlibacter sp.]